MPKTNFEAIAPSIIKALKDAKDPTQVESCVIMMATTLAAYLDAHERLYQAPLWDDSSARAGFTSLIAGFEHLALKHEVGRLSREALQECITHLKRYGKPRGE